MNKAKLKVPERSPWNLLVLSGLLLLTLAFVATTFFLLARKAGHEQRWIRLATEVQVSSQQLSKSGAEAASGNIEAFNELAMSHDRILRAMATLRSGAPTEGLPPAAGQVSEELNQLEMTWNRMNGNAEHMRELEPMVIRMVEAHRALSESLAQIQANAEVALNALADGSAPVDQVAAVGRQPVMIERMSRRIAEILRGGSGTASAASELEADMVNFEATLKALRNGDSGMRVSQVQNAQARASLTRVAEAFDKAEPQLQDILESSTAMFEVRGAADEVFLDSRIVFGKAGNLAAALANLPNTRIWPSILTGVTGLGLMLVIAALLIRSAIRVERTRATAATERDQQNQKAIKRLLDELGSLANGDLTVQATVGEELTRDIAAAVNYAVQRLREIVTGINDTAHAVSESAEFTRASAAKLAEAAGQQARQMDSATEDVNQMAVAFDSMARQSHESSEVAKNSVKIAANGAEKVQQTIGGMDHIREQIQETSKRIKRLGESTQEIGDIVGLINGIAEQTNVLALNAAIQAASAGGAGKGFAMVADEVQELAESATQATRRIESLVHTIQADTAEAVHSMETTTSEVVRGANLAEDAGAALQKIEAVSSDLSGRIQEISEEAQSQSSAATGISELMHGVRDVSVENAKISNQAAETIDNLAELVLKLSESVSDFKLPAGKHDAGA